MARHVRVHVVAPTRFGVPADPAMVRDCGSCGAPVWLLTSIRAAPRDELLCVVCAMSAVRVGHIWTVSTDTPLYNRWEDVEG